MLMRIVLIAEHLYIWVFTGDNCELYGGAEIIAQGMAFDNMGEKGGIVT